METLEEKKSISNLFDGIADIYDKFNHILSLNIDKTWRRKAIKKMQPAHSVLDVAVGTGDLTIEVLKQQKAKHVVGIDLSDEMMRIAQQKLQKYHYEQLVELQNVNAQNMPFSSQEFDAVTCAYGIRNFANLQQGLLEMFRVLKPGGQLVILEFSYPTNPVIRFVYDIYFSRIMPLFGRLLSKRASAFVYFNRSVKQFIWGEELAAVLRECGFMNVEYQTLTFGISTLYLARKGE